MRRTVVAVLLLFAGTAHAMTIWCFGDSITANYCDNLAAWRPSDVVVNAGVGGERTLEGVARAADLLASMPVPDVVVLEEGTNDCFWWLDTHDDDTWGAEIAADRLTAIRQLFLDAGAQVITATTVGRLKGRSDASQWLRYYRARMRALVPRVEFALRSSLLYDGIHPNGTGQLLLTMRVEQAIRRLLRP
jgi:lysophospholipase L1-like esterase